MLLSLCEKKKKSTDQYWTSTELCVVPDPVHWSTLMRPTSVTDCGKELRNLGHVTHIIQSVMLVMSFLLL